MRFLPNSTHIDLYWQRSGEADAHLEHFDDLGHDYAYRKELRDFVHWVRYGTEPCLTWREGLRCVEVLEAVQRSAEEEGTVIELPLYPQLEKLTEVE
jgi:predicted dehydrogenase